MKEPAASPSRRILFGGLLGRKENRRVCVCVKRGCENDFLQGRLVGLEPRVNHSSSLNCTMKQRWLEEVTKWPCRLLPVFIASPERGDILETDSVFCLLLQGE